MVSIKTKIKRALAHTQLCHEESRTVVQYQIGVVQFQLAYNISQSCIQFLIWLHSGNTESEPVVEHVGTNLYNFLLSKPEKSVLITSA